MVRLFHVYYPVRTLVLLACEAIIVYACFAFATLVRLGADNSYLVLSYENGWSKILAVTIICLLCSYYFDLYAPQLFGSRAETTFRVLLVLGVMSFLLASLMWLFPGVVIANGVFLIGLVILTFALLGWRGCYLWIVQLPMLRERVYVMGAGERANHVVQAIRTRADLGMEVVGWAGAAGGGELEREALAESIRTLHTHQPVDRVIVAMSDRRGTMPVRELLDLRLTGTRIEDASTLLEQVNGKIEIDDLHPSAMIFSEGFRVKRGVMLARRLVSFTIATLALILCLPLLPILALMVKLSSPGPVLFRQQRVGFKGAIFTVCKFRTMRQDAEQNTGAVWAGKNDPRVTSVGRFMRKTRLDEIPQLWNVLRGDMGFVGPRPERPEFVQWLQEQVPYYNLRHIIRPGLTGWAQVRYRYGASLEETRQKIQYDLYYVKHMSVALDLFIIFETIKTVLLRRGAQ
jgi:sugar transferase (PEP-CTERM system associated)